MAAGAATTLAAIPHVAAIFILSVALPVIIYHLTTGSPSDSILALTFGIFAIAILATSRVVNVALLRQFNAERQAQRLRDVALEQKVAVLANEAASMDDALQRCLNEVCLYLQWPVGHVYILAQDGSGDLVPTTTFETKNSTQNKTILESSRASRVGPGAGFPGHVLEQGKPLLVFNGEDSKVSSGFPELRPMVEAGLVAALGIPVLIGRNVVAVMELFSTDQRPGTRLQ